jgi:hypothetical protein
VVLGRRFVDIGVMKTLALFALLATAAFANPASTPVEGVISQDATGYLVKTEVIQHYTRLCKLFPQFGDKPGDGVFVVDEGVFHLDTAHYNDFLTMAAREHTVSFLGGLPVAAEMASAN